VVVALALALSVAFGAGDQYLGSLTGSGHLWAAGWSSDVSLLSAPWLVLPFLAGATQRPRVGPRSSVSRARTRRCSATG
jgi:hypothetical protein